MTGSGAREVWAAPAKINLWLEIRGRRQDGYHAVDVGYQAIDLADEVELDPGAEPGVTCRVAGPEAGGVPDGAENLAARAALLLAERLGHEPRVALEIAKRIPAGAGLGGGSSDAAATLLALARRFAVPDPVHTLHDLAAELGADVPFFLRGGTMRGTGTGDELTPIEPPAERWGILAWPAGPVSSGWAYRAWDESGAEPGPPGAGGWRERGNDLEPVVVAARPEVGRAIGALAAGPAAGARMTGSGSAAFALYARGPDRDADLPRVRAALPDATVRAFATVDHGVRPIR